MIVDKLENAPFYYGLNEKIEKALKYLKVADLINIENGKYEIDKDDIFVILQDYMTKPEHKKSCLLYTIFLEF